MRAIVGLGNPGNKYKLNRHNAGFLFLDYLAERESIKFNPSKGNYYYAEGCLEKFPYLLVKPATFVNLSGSAVTEIMDNFSLKVDDLLIVHDEINLELGTAKIKASGSDGGHNGISSIIYCLNANNFARVRLGIGNNFKEGDLSSYVLSNFDKEEIESLKKIFIFTEQLCKAFIIGGIKKMLDTNSRLMSGENKSIDKTNEQIQE